MLSRMVPTGTAVSIADTKGRVVTTSSSRTVPGLTGKWPMEYTCSTVEYRSMVAEKSVTSRADNVAGRDCRRVGIMLTAEWLQTGRTVDLSRDSLGPTLLTLGD